MNLLEKLFRSLGLVVVALVGFIVITFASVALNFYNALLEVLKDNKDLVSSLFINFKNVWRV